MDTVILIPAYKPEQTLVLLSRALQEQGFSVLIVDDGSGREFSPVFRAAQSYATVIGYAKNGGKGHALKYGIEYLHREMPECRCFITADADGQHAVRDIVRVSERLHETGGIVLGSRAFTGAIPLRSRVGNDLSRFAYTIAATLYLKDNQSGLRGFESGYAEWLLSIGGQHYDYEINVLMYAAKQNLPIHELTIETIYNDGNKSSHFQPVLDTLRLHAKILLASVPSLFSFLCMIAAALYLYGRMAAARLPFAMDVSVVAAGSFGILMSFVLNTTRFSSPAGVPYRLSWRKLLAAVFRLAAYQAMMELLFYFLRLPYGLSLALTVLLVLVEEFYLHKLIFVLKKLRFHTQ
jgi:glycosyltransferase involved in cell wall biosynthesis